MIERRLATVYVRPQFEPVWTEATAYAKSHHLSLSVFVSMALAHYLKVCKRREGDEDEDEEE